MAASNNGSIIEDSWEGIRENPVYQRVMWPKGPLGFLNSPVARAIGVGAAGFLSYDVLIRPYFMEGPLGIVILLGYVVIFWTLMRTLHHYFAWADLREMERTGELYQLAGNRLTREDVTLGAIFPAEFAERITILVVILGFVIRAYLEESGFFLIFSVILAMNAFSLMAPPMLFLPDAENYFRREPLKALASITSSKLIPTFFWFIAFFSLFLLFTVVLMVLGMYQSAFLPMVIALVVLIMGGRQIGEYWAKRRLEAFYKRNRDFTDLFDRFIKR